MKKNGNRIMNKITDLAYNVSKLSANSASWWGFYQRKEPEKLRKLNKFKSI